MKKKEVIPINPNMEDKIKKNILRFCSYYNYLTVFCKISKYLETS